MSRRKPLAALAALGAAAALAFSSPSANAQTLPLSYTPPVFLCYSLVYGIQGALATGNQLRANLLSQTFIYLHCGGAAI
jgi:hypothetical protein